MRASDVPMTDWSTESRCYHSDDRDLRGGNNDLIVSQGGNGDWYLTIVPHGQKIGPTVRLTTHGSPRGMERVAPAVANLYRALGGKVPEPEIDDGPVVCGGCYAVGAEPHAHDCIDEQIRLDQETRRTTMAEGINRTRPGLAGYFAKSIRELASEVRKLLRDAVFGVMAATPRHTYQVLTKRPARMLEFFSWLERREPSRPRLEVVYQALCSEQAGDDEEKPQPLHSKHCADPEGPWPLPNVWLGVSVESQAAADERIPLLLQVPAVVRFLSCEPLLGPIDLSPPCCDLCGGFEVAQEPGGQPWCVGCDHEMGDPGWLDPEGINWVMRRAGGAA